MSLLILMMAMLVIGLECWPGGRRSTGSTPPMKE